MNPVIKFNFLKNFSALKRSIQALSNLIEEADIRGYKFDSEVNIGNLFDKTTRSISHETDGFKATGFSTVGEQSTPDMAKEVLDFFKSRKAPEEPRIRKPVRNLLSNSKKGMRKFNEQAALRRKLPQGELALSAAIQSRLPPKPMVSASQRQAELGPARFQQQTLKRHQHTKQQHLQKQAKLHHQSYFPIKQNGVNELNKQRKIQSQQGKQKGNQIINMEQQNCEESLTEEPSLDSILASGK